MLQYVFGVFADFLIVRAETTISLQGFELSGPQH